MKPRAWQIPATTAPVAGDFIERFLGVWPDADPPEWSEAVVTPKVIEGAERCFAGLRAPARTDDPIVHRLTPAARRAFAAWSNENTREIRASTGLARSVYAKYLVQLLRIALVLHVLRDSRPSATLVSRATVADAIVTVEYFAEHLRRILPRFGAAGSVRNAGLGSRIMRLLHRADGDWVSRTDIHRGLGARTAAEAIAAELDAFAAAGLVETRTIHTGARPREEWRRCHMQYAEMHEWAEVERQEGEV